MSMACRTKDPRHAEMMLKACPEMSAVTSPGEREDNVDYDNTLDQEIAAEKPSDNPPNINSLKTKLQHYNILCREQAGDHRPC